MFDHEGVKICESDLKFFDPLFTCQIYKNWSLKKYEVKGITCIIPIDLWLLKIYSTTLLNEFLM